MEQRKEQMLVVVMESMEIGWSFLQGISLTGPNPVPHDFDFGDHLTGALESLRAPNSWCIDCGGRLTAI
jgi:hypothetical protein